MRGWTVMDSDILEYNFIMLDFDPVPYDSNGEKLETTDVSATDEEKERALQTSNRVKNYLAGSDFGDAFFADSGNGYRLLYRCKLNPRSDKQLVRHLTKKLSKKFSDKCVKLDIKTYNPSRIDKIIGTWARKGAEDKEAGRVYRKSTVVEAPDIDKMVVLGETDVRKVVEDLTVEQQNTENTDKSSSKSSSKQAASTSNEGAISPEYEFATQFLEHYSTVIGGYVEKDYDLDDGREAKKFIFEVCPIDDSHNDGKAACLIVPMTVGGGLAGDQVHINFTCRRTSCRDNGIGWKQFQEAVIQKGLKEGIEELRLKGGGRKFTENITGKFSRDYLKYKLFPKYDTISMSIDYRRLDVKPTIAPDETAFIPANEMRFPAGFFRHLIEDVKPWSRYPIKYDTESLGRFITDVFKRYIHFKGREMFIWHQDIGHWYMHTADPADAKFIVEKLVREMIKKLNEIVNYRYYEFLESNNLSIDDYSERDITDLKKDDLQAEEISNPGIVYTCVGLKKIIGLKTRGTDWRNLVNEVLSDFKGENSSGWENGQVLKIGEFSPLVVTQNCTIDTSKWQGIHSTAGVLPNKPESGQCAGMDCVYNPWAELPINYYTVCEGLYGPRDTDLYQHFQKVSGQTLLGLGNQQCLTFDKGIPGCGKSTKNEAILKIMGSYGFVISWSDLTAGSKDFRFQSFATNPFGRFGYVDEVDENQSMNHAAINSLTAGGSMRVKPLYSNGFVIENKPFIILSCNEMPNLTKADEAMIRRLMVLETIAETEYEQRDVIQDMKDRILKERSGVFNDMLNGLLKLGKDDLLRVAPIVWQEAKREAIDDVDPVLQYFYYAYEPCMDAIDFLDNESNKKKPFDPELNGYVTPDQFIDGFRKWRKKSISGGGTRETITDKKIIQSLNKRIEHNQLPQEFVRTERKRLVINKKRRYMYLGIKAVGSGRSFT